MSDRGHLQGHRPSRKVSRCISMVTIIFAVWVERPGTAGSDEDVERMRERKQWQVNLDKLLVMNWCSESLLRMPEFRRRSEKINKEII